MFSQKGVRPNPKKIESIFKMVKVDVAQGCKVIIRIGQFL